MGMIQSMLLAVEVVVVVVECKEAEVVGMGLELGGVVREGGWGLCRVLCTVRLRLGWGWGCIGTAAATAVEVWCIHCWISL
jgi:hypothetical protein